MQKITQAAACAPRSFIKMLKFGTMSPLFGDVPMDVNLIRKIRIAELIEQEGGQRKFAERIGSDEAYVSSILSDKSKRNLGDELARRVETAYELEPGSLDFPDEKTQTAMMKFILLDDDDQQQALDFISFKYTQADTDLASTPQKLASYFKTIAGMISAREKKRKK